MSNTYTTEKGHVIDLTQILDIDSSLIGSSYMVYLNGKAGFAVSEGDRNQIVVQLAEMQMDANRSKLTL